MDNLKALFKKEQDFQYLTNLFDEIHFSNKLSGFELYFKQDFEKFFGYSPMEQKFNNYIESEFCQSYEPEFKKISFIIITKNFFQKSSDTNFMRKIFDKFIPKLFIFFSKIIKLYESKINKFIEYIK